LPRGSFRAEGKDRDIDPPFFLAAAASRRARSPPSLALAADARTPERAPATAAAALVFSADDADDDDEEEEAVDFPAAALLAASVVLARDAPRWAMERDHTALPPPPAPVPPAPLRAGLAEARDRGSLAPRRPLARAPPPRPEAGDSPRSLPLPVLPYPLEVAKLLAPLLPRGDASVTAHARVRFFTTCRRAPTTVAGVAGEGAGARGAGTAGGTGDDGGPSSGVPRPTPAAAAMLGRVMKSCFMVPSTFLWRSSAATSQAIWYLSGIARTLWSDT